MASPVGMISTLPMSLEVSHFSPPACDSPSAPSTSSPSPSLVSPTTAQRMIALTTTATPSVTQNTSSTRRPKLSLQTASVPLTFGNSSTGFARTCATASPTVRNTFNNAYEVTRPLSAVDSPSPCRLSSKGIRHASPYSFNCNYYRSSEVAPYQQPLGVRSILRNSPLMRLSVTRHSVSISAGAASENRRVFFPARKQVSFRSHLEEEIRTVRFVARHSDLNADPEPESEAESECESGSDSNGSQSDSHSSSGEDERDVKERPYRKRRKSVPSERQIRAAALRDGLTANYSAVSEPTQSKRRRKWRWTLDECTASNTVDSENQPPSPLHPLQQSISPKSNTETSSCTFL
ncbi:hypothetical protein BGW36DRAFT_407635 [Talaromyces proteolyticus]|uniref:Uncharacterized protein n=1 Tax=Talaromyces proteolyticus TaxID=1131652 RepID=A0AAD4PYE7_9EURO|nr:uncharacterized protein BGW36DRAFT_407635 [Talaromyces proteolyticus]KAH8697664.1 hypothetical protein BGW36DRAFT_407635 [Talaromyces proteolyticus]